MKTQISNSLKDNMSSIQLKLNDFGLKDPIKKNTEELFKTKNTRPINQEYVYLNDNHFEYDNPTCSHCHKKHEKRGFPVAGSWKSFDQKKFENLFEDVKIYFLS